MSLPTSQQIQQTVGIILAAGKGTRMRSALPKVLHQAAGRPMIQWVRSALASAGITRHCLVLSEDLTGFERLCTDDRDLTIAIQVNRRGTGDAVAATACCFADVQTPPYASGILHAGEVVASEYSLVCAGDVPCVKADSYANFVKDCLSRNAELGVLGMQVPDPYGYGRLVQNETGDLLAIVEEKDADASTKDIRTCNTGIIFAKTKTLFSLLSRITDKNAAGEYYLTDCFVQARAEGLKTHVHVGDDFREFGGVNNRSQLSESEQILMGRLRQSMLENGVTIHCPETVFVEADVVVQEDCEIFPHVSLRGTTTLESACQIGAGSYLENVAVGSGVVVGPGCVLQDCVIKESVAAGTVRTM